MKLVLNPSYCQLRNFVQKLPISFPTLGDCIYKARNELRKFSYEGQWYVVKNYKVPLFINRIAYTFFRPSKASRAYEYALRLRSMGIETPAPVAYIELKSGGLLQHSFFVSENCSYPRMMREFEEGGIAGREDILDAFAAFTVDLHKKGKYFVRQAGGKCRVFYCRLEPYAVSADDSENVFGQFQSILPGRVGRAICRRRVCPFTRVGRGCFHRGGSAGAQGVLGQDRAKRCFEMSPEETPFSKMRGNS